MVEVYPVCRSREISAEFQRVLEEGWNRVFQRLKDLGVGAIADLPGLEVSLLDDPDMARLHDRFLGDPTTTDVITFAHGELLIGVETACRQAVDYQTGPDQEIALYGIHGMLHLAGFDDREEDEARRMAVRQEELFREIFAPVFKARSFF